MPEKILLVSVQNHKKKFYNSVNLCFFSVNSFICHALLLKYTGPVVSGFESVFLFGFGSGKNFLIRIRIRNTVQCP
jgi:hypothetical protein